MILRFFGIACAGLLAYALVSPTLELVFHTSLRDWGIDSYWRSFKNERNITSAAILSILLAGGWNVILAVVRKIAWYLDFPARFRDRVRELDRDPPEPKP